MLAAGAGVVHGDVGLAAAADDGAALRSGVALAVDLEHRGPVDVVLAHVGGVDAQDPDGERRRSASSVMRPGPANE